MRSHWFIKPITRTTEGGCNGGTHYHSALELRTFYQLVNHYGSSRAILVFEHVPFRAITSTVNYWHCELACVTSEAWQVQFQHKHVATSKLSVIRLQIEGDDY